MKLTEKDKKYLLDLGHSPSDFPQIEAVTRYTTYERKGKEPGAGFATISQEEAVQLLGREEFLSGLSRSAFHASAVRESDTGECVYFDSSRFFR